MSKNTKELVPKLRFPEFRDLGEWAYLNGNDVFDQISNKKHSSDLPILAITQEYGAIPRDQIDYHVSVTDKSVESYKVVEIGDFIISLRSFQGGIEYSDYKGLCSPAYVILRKKMDVSNFFFKNYFKSNILIADLNKDIEGIRDGKMVSFKQFSELLMPVPRLDEQKKIADCLSSIDDLISAQSQKVEALRTHKKGLMLQLFPREGETVPRLRFPEFRDSGEWKEKALGQLATYTKGFAFKSQDYRSQGIRVVRVSDLGTDSIKPNNEKIFVATESASDYERYVLNKGEIIITTVGSKPDLIESAVGRGIFVHHSNEGLLNQNLLKLEAMSGVNSRFLFSNINTEKYQKFIASISRGNANQANIAVKNLMDFELQMPTPKEQQKIADCLSTIDNLFNSQNQRLETLKTHKKGLMQQLFPVANDKNTEVNE